MEYGIAWDDEPENPLPHAWQLGPDRYPTEAEALAVAAEAATDWGGNPAYLVVRIYTD